MKKIVFACLLTIFLSQDIAAQKVTVESLKKSELSNYKKVVSQSLIYRDAQTAINGMHLIIALEGKNSVYKDSLAIVYYQSKNYLSGHLLAKELLIRKPNDIKLLEINAICLHQLSATKEAIGAYEKLFSKTNNMMHGYQLAYLQYYGIKRLAEARETITKTLISKEQKDLTIPFPVDKTKSQNVPLKAAVYNLQGNIAFDLKENINALNAFTEALKIMPEFVIAKQNNDAILSLQEGK